jgi:MYXO-CTERM domain-containing protein
MTFIHIEPKKSPPELGGITMRNLKLALRTVFAGIMLSAGVAGAAPADFTADVGLTLAFVAKSTTETTTSTIAYGGTRQVKATLSVPAGAFVAQGITVDAVIPTGLKVTAVTNCTATAAAVTAGTKFPCTVANLQDGGSVVLTITLSQAMPSPLPTVCNQTATYTPFTVSVTTTSVDPVTTNNSASVTPTGVPLVFADLDAVTFTGPATAAAGATVVYDVTVTNHGPCAAPDVWAYSNAYGLTYVSTTATCANAGAGVDLEADGCELGAMASGASLSYTKTYVIPAMPKDLLSKYMDNSISLVDETPTKDLDTSNNDSASVRTVTTQSATGCSSAGAGGPAALLMLGAALFMAFRRRRTA